MLRASLELGYKPNFAARALASGKSHIVAVVFPHVYETPFKALASLEILASIEAFCSQNGYHVLISSPRLVDGKVDASFTSLLAGGYPDGVILDSHMTNVEPIMAVLDEFRVPTVVLGYHPHRYYLRSDNFAGGQLIARHILELGHRRIGIIGVADGTSVSADWRLKGIRRAFEELNFDYTHVPRCDGTYSSDSGAGAAAQLLTAHPDLTALIVLNDRMAFGAVRQLQAMGYRVPEQISVTGYDDLPQARDFRPPLTTINQHLPEWGALSMTVLLELLAGREPQPVCVPPELVVRESTARAQ